MRTLTHTSTAAAFAAAVLLVVACAETPSVNSTVIRIHPAAREIPVSTTISAVGELVQEIVTRFESADSLLRLSVDEKLIREIRSRRAVEVLFDPPREIVLRYNGRRLVVRSLLVPLEGEMADGQTVLFYATGSSYASGPMNFAEGTDGLAELAAQVLADFVD